MKKTILLALTALITVGCDVKQPDGTYKPCLYRTYIIDSCEYVGYAAGSQSDFLAHKGNCRFCKERRQKELEELIIKGEITMAIITEDYVSFETAKLLNDKGFNEPTLAYAYGNDMISYYSKPRITDVINIQAGRIPMPTLRMAIKWLREVHDIDVSIIPLRSHKEYLPRIESDTISHDAIPYRKYEKAAEVAIKYCLENLI